MGGRRPAGRHPNGGRAGRGIRFERIAGAEEKIAMDGAARGESRDWRCGGVPVSGNGGDCPSVGGSAAAISVCAGIFELPRDTGAAGGACEIEEHAGFAFLRWAGLRASAKDGTGHASRNFAEPADNWLRKKHFDWITPRFGRKSWELDGADGRQSCRRKNRRSSANAGWSESNLCFAGASCFARERDSPDYGR